MNDPDAFDAFVQATRDEFEPTRADRERVKRHLGARLGVGLAGSAAATAGATASGKAVLGGQSLLALGKLLLGTVAVTVASGTALLGGSRALSSVVATPHRAASSVAAPVVVPGAGSPDAPQSAKVVASEGAPDIALSVGNAPAASDAEVTHTTPAPAAAKPRRAAALPTMPNATASASPTTLAHETPALVAELALLKEAKRADADGDSTGALDLLGRLDREQTNGALLEEREALRVVISCKRGDVTGPQRAAAFARRYEHSVYLARLAAACASTAQPGALRDSAAPVPSSVTGSTGVGH